MSWPNIYHLGFSYVQQQCVSTIQSVKLTADVFVTIKKNAPDLYCTQVIAHDQVAVVGYLYAA